MSNKMRDDLYREIVRNIVMAQDYSDAAKRACYGSSGHYKRKQDCINAAVKLINTNPYVGVRYRSVKAPDQNGNRSRIFYFEVNYYGNVYQISFHSFQDLDKKDYGTESISWDHGDSRKNCHTLTRKLRLEIRFAD